MPYNATVNNNSFPSETYKHIAITNNINFLEQAKLISIDIVALSFADLINSP